MRKSYRHIIGFVCSALLLSFVGPVLAQQNPSPPNPSPLPVLAKVSQRLDGDRVLALLRLHRLYELLPLFFHRGGPLALDKPEQLIELLPMNVRMMLKMTGVNFQKGAVIAVQRSLFRMKKLPVDISLWIWLEDPNVLTGMLGMLNKGGMSEIIHVPNPQRQQDYFLVKVKLPGAPWLLVTRDQNLLSLATIAPPSSPRWWSSFSSTWLERVSKVFNQMLNKHPKALANQKDYQTHRLRFGPAQITAFLRPKKIINAVQRSVPFLKMIPQISIVKRALQSFGFGLQVAGTRVSTRERLGFGALQNPVLELTTPLAKPVDLTRLLPKHTIFFNSTTFHFSKMKSFLLKLAKRFSVPERAQKKALREYESFRQRFLVHMGVDLENDVLNQLSGHFGSAMLLHDPKQPPILSTDKGLALFLGIRDKVTFASSFKRFLNHLQSRRILSFRTFPLQGHTAHEIRINAHFSFFVVLDNYGLKLSMDQLTLSQIINTPPTQESLASRLSKSPYLLTSVQKGFNATFFDFESLHNWFKYWEPSLPAGRIGKSLRRVMMFRDQMLRARSGFFVTRYKKDHIEGVVRGWTAQPEPRDPAVPVHKTRPFALTQKYHLPVWVAFALFSTPTLLSSPSFGGMGLLGGGAGFFFLRGKPQRRRYRRKRSRVLYKRSRSRRFHRGTPKPHRAKPKSRQK